MRETAPLIQLKTELSSIVDLMRQFWQKLFFIMYSRAECVSFNAITQTRTTKMEDLEVWFVSLAVSLFLACVSFEETLFFDVFQTARDTVRFRKKTKTPQNEKYVCENFCVYVPACLDAYV